MRRNQMRLSRLTKSELHATPGEIVRDTIISAGVSAIEETGYVADTKTDALVKRAQKSVDLIDGGTALAGGSESATARGRVTFKTIRDRAWGEMVCTGLCLVSGTCEAIALGYSTMKRMPFRGRIYLSSKLISRGCITFRNACTGEGC